MDTVHLLCPPNFLPNGDVNKVFHRASKTLLKVSVGALV